MKPTSIFLMIVLTAVVSTTATQHYGRAASKLPPPKLLNVRGHKWDVVDARDSQVLLDDLKQRHAIAMSMCSVREIIYDSHDEDVRNSLWHEVFHAGACDNGGSIFWNSQGDGDTEHQGIQHLADFMEDFTRTNPNFIEWEDK